MALLPPFNIDALVVFSRVVECRSISRAAASLGIPKSTVSRQIAKLEADLGVRLLRKSTHQVSVTDLGDKIYAHSTRILAEANGVLTLAEQSKQEPQGMLRVAIPVFIGIDYASRVGTSFLQHYPKSQLELRLVDTMVHPIKDGFDIVFGTGPLQDSTLIARKAFSLESFLCASPTFLASLPEPLSEPVQLLETPFIDSGFYGVSRKKLVLTQGRKRFELSPSVRASANNFQISKQYLLNGLGVGALPNRILCAQELKEGTIVPVLPEWTLEPVEVYMIYPFQLSFSSLISAFYEIAVGVIAENSSIDRPLSGSARR